MEPSPDKYFTTDRELLAAIFSGLAALSLELTGKRLVACFRKDDVCLDMHGGSNVKLAPITLEGE